MSEFDKEAEREKLRKQFAEDEKDREETERMSELLLGGATMTNKHCENCGSPLFRQNGRTFCPTCQQPMDAADSQATSEPEQTPEENVPEPNPPAPDSRRDPSVSTPERTGSGGLDEARAGLVRTITRFVRRAEATEDAQRARELLSTAREAAETLEAVDRVYSRND